MSKGMNKNTQIEMIKLVQGIGREIDWNDKKNMQLVDAILTLKNSDEAKCFLRDLMTEKEISEFANRLEAARLLVKDVQDSEIIEKTGLSSTTIARISKWLKGPLGGYRLVLNKLPARNAGRIATAGGHHTHSQNSVGKGLILH
jgi:TrpR-related protein YerC/YecD